ncbi:FxSxx-COOH system tetratricopeptide repeat protein [Actinosynnema sp. NPDC047251]|uniref:CobQ/CobB/MinD/ParA nucleotide binding domain-containing protein n=1 Tax=Saccharothrix espanaensis (strain ATCC 51144 / DSM 44229 / JCM 9112 / NBRC 15066 / NRRL 15764) TaxID=1179773 RepID=K0K6H0_SACES|nr:FxSxx-COOH system tetratricopeptide repeat protein [Saccharothrix espanaensis]CCH32504.1 hypothetical protein BN6_52400 [Saccharothrix espanaensis DSM 44229]
MSSSRRATAVAFLSTSGSTGRTSAVANLAWVLSSVGHRVLVLDRGSEPPRVEEYLSRFHVHDVEPPDPATTARRYAMPGWTGHVDVHTPDGGADARASAGPVAPVVRSAAERYDYVLLDAPTGRDDGSLAAIADVAHVGVVCFVPRPRAIRDAAALAGAFRGLAVRPVDVVPLVTMFDHGYDPRARQSLDLIRAEFSGLAGDEPGRTRATIQLPHRPFEAFDPLLAVLVEDPDDTTGLREQYEKLAAAVTDGRVTRMGPVRRSTRSRYRRAFGLEAVAEPDRVLVACHPADRAWADWVCELHRSAGTRAVLLRGHEEWLDDGAPVEVLVIRSARWEGSPRQARLARLLAGRDVDVRWVRVDGDPDRAVAVDPDRAAADGPEVVVADLDGPDARARLLTGLDLVGGADADEPGGFPGGNPLTSLLPNRLAGFVGRDEELEAVRDRLLDGGGPVTVGGAPGVGKSELALEYAHRFKGLYHAVWWVPAHDRQAAMISLSRLAAATRSPGRAVEVAAAGRPAWPLTALGSPGGSPRWLLVYDNADSPGALEGLVPLEGPGHVLITTSAGAADVEPAELPPEDARCFLLDRVPGLGADAAERVSAALGRLPLALRLGGSWLAETVARERLAATRTTDAVAWSARTLLDALAGGGRPDLVGRLVSLVVDALSREAAGRTAVALAELCSFLSCQGIGLRLVRSAAVVSALVEICGEDAEPLRLDSWEVDRALWLCVRFGLFQVDWGEHNSVRVHRAVQQALIDRMPADERERRHARALRALAAFAPTEAEEAEESDDGRRNRAWHFRELQKHVFPSRAMDSDDDVVRRWLVSQLRFLYTDGGAEVGLLSMEPAHALLARWTARFGPDDALRARLATQLANVERKTGKAETALKLDESALNHQRETLGLTSTQTLISARGFGGDLRGEGYFSESLDEDQTTWSGFRQNFGDDHPHTRSAANNLAEALLLCGEPGRALALEQDNFARRMRLFGDKDPNTWWSLMRVGVYQREVGEYEKAGHALRRAAQRLKFGGGTSAAELAARWHLAITERLMGDVKGARTRNAETLARFQEVLGPFHPETLACALSLAVAERAAGEAAGAVERSRHVVAGLCDEVGLSAAHPFVGLARLCLGLSLRAAGDVEDGAREVAAAHGILVDRLTESHPWTLAAAVAVARLTAAGGDTSTAVKQLTRTFRRCRTFLGAGHRTTRVAEHNLARTREPGAERDNGWRDSDVDIAQT